MSLSPYSWSDIDLDRRPQALSFLSATSSDLLNLFPKPLTFRRTFTSHSPLSAPVAHTKINGSLGSYSLGLASPFQSPMRRSRSERPQCRLSALQIIHRHTTTRFSLDRANIEYDPFIEQPEAVRRSDGVSVNSLSTLKPPQASRRCSGAASSIYSRDTHDMSLHTSPAFASEGSTRVQANDDQTRRNFSFDESIFRDLDWMHETTIGNNLSRLSELVDSGASVGRSVSCHVAPYITGKKSVELTTTRKPENASKIPRAINGGCTLARHHTVGAHPSNLKSHQAISVAAPGGAAWV